MAVALTAWLLGRQALAGFGGIEDLPLPGGAELGDRPYQVTAEFADVLSLVPHSSVKVNDVPVGRVTGIRLAGDGWTALVTLRINGDVELPANAVARLEQSGLLGEKYVQLAPPGDRAPRGRLADGDTIPLDRTTRTTEVEEVFGALSMLLSGGGVEQIATISGELNAMMAGNEPELRSVLGRLHTLTTSLDANKDNITAAIGGLDALAVSLAGHETEITTALDGLPPGLEALAGQRTELVDMLTALDDLSGTAVATVEQSRDDVVAGLEALAPVLRNLADAGQSLPDSLQVLATYPFTDEVLTGIKGDYLNAYLHLVAAPGTELIPPLDPGRGPSPEGGAG
nr:MCE family protein [Streptomyces sp. YIM 98790]